MHLILGMALVMQPVLAADVSDGLRICADVREDAERLRCFDRLAAAQPDPAADAEAHGGSVPGRSERRTIIQPHEDRDRAVNAAELFGLDEESIQRGERSLPEPPDSIVAAIEKIEERPWGERVVYLDNGQVWLETSRNRKLLLSAGDEITVKAAFLGSYKLIGSGGKRTTRVKRLK